MIQRFSIAKDDQWYLAFPDVTLTALGHLVCVFSQCTHHHRRTVTQVMLVESEDRGRTWSKPRALSEKIDNDPEGWHWNCPRISTLADGRVVALCDKVQGQGGDAREDGGQTNWMWISGDEAATWDGPIATPVFGIVPDQLVELKHGPHAGRWLLSAHSKARTEPGMICAQRLWWSDDQGASWQGPSVVAQSQEFWFCEGSVLELPNGELVCFLRENSGLGYDAFKAISRDGGSTWGEPTRMPIPACHRPVAGMLKSGQVLITHRLRQGGKNWHWQAQNFCAALTDVESCLASGRHEAHARILPIDYDRARDADTGYSGWVQFTDGEIYVVNYIVDDHAPLAQIRGYALRLEDFVLEPPAHKTSPLSQSLPENVQ